MDSGLATALSTALTGFSGDAIDQLTAVLPIAITVVVSVAVLFLGIRIFRAIAHV